MLVSTSIMIRIDESPPLIRNTIIKKKSTTRKSASKERKYAPDSGDVAPDGTVMSDGSVIGTVMLNTKKVCTSMGYHLAECRHVPLGQVPSRRNRNLTHFTDFNSFRSGLKS